MADISETTLQDNNASVPSSGDAGAPSTPASPNGKTAPVDSSESLLDKPAADAMKLTPDEEPAQSIKLLREGASQKERDEFYKALGRPDKVEDYKLETPELPKGLEVDKKFERTMLKEMHKNGLTTAQANSIFGKYYKHLVDKYTFEAQNMEANKEASAQQLKRELGSEYEQSLLLARKGVDEVGGEEVRELLKKHGLGSNPEIIKMFSKIGGAMTESTLPEGAQASGGSSDGSRNPTTPADAEAQLDRLYENPDFLEKLRDKSHPGHKAALKRVEDLARMTDPTGDVTKVTW